MSDDKRSDDRTAGNEIGEHLAEGHPRGCGKAIGDLAAKLLHANKHIFSLQRTVLALTKMLEYFLAKEDSTVLTDAKPIADRLLEEAREEGKREAIEALAAAGIEPVEQAVAAERERLLNWIKNTDSLYGTPYTRLRLVQSVRAELDAPAEEQCWHCHDAGCEMCTGIPPDAPAEEKDTP